MMPIGEDLPALIPISFAIAILIVGLAGMYVNYIEKTEANALHRAGLNAAELFAYRDGGVIENSSLNCTYLNASSAIYHLRVNATDLRSGRSIGCGPALNYPVTVSVPALIRYANGTTDEAKIYVQVMRK